MTIRIPAQVVKLGNVLDLITEVERSDGQIARTTWSGADVGGLAMCCDARAMDKDRAALYLLRVRTPNPRKPKAKEGYTDCACRDCFDIAIGTPGRALCSECEQAGCEANDGECQRSDAYGVEDDSRSENATPSKNAARTYEGWHEREPDRVTDVDGLPDDLPHYIGRAVRIGYRSDKWHARGEAEDYDHDYTEPGYRAPEVWADSADLARAKAIVLKGGNQRVTPAGID